CSLSVSLSPARFSSTTFHNRGDKLKLIRHTSNFFVNPQSSLRRRPPTEILCSPQTFFAQHLAKRRIINHSGERVTQCLSVEWIEKQTRIANNFGQAGLISDRKSTRLNST